MRGRGRGFLGFSGGLGNSRSDGVGSSVDEVMMGNLGMSVAFGKHKMSASIEC